MQFTTTLLASILALVCQVSTFDDGMWHPQGVKATPTPVVVGSSAVITPQAVAIPAVHPAGNNGNANAIISPAAAAITPIPLPNAAAPVDWQMSVTWPVGCDKWANPCPPGAKISGGGIAGGVVAAATGTPIRTPLGTPVGTPAASPTPVNENPSTPLATPTGSHAMITPMPAKATNPAGMVVGDAAIGYMTTLVRSAGTVAVVTPLSPSASPTIRSFISANAAGSVAPISFGKMTTILGAAALLFAVL